MNFRFSIASFSWVLAFVFLACLTTASLQAQQAIPLRKLTPVTPGIRIVPSEKTITPDDTSPRGDRQESQTAKPAIKPSAAPKKPATSDSQLIKLLLATKLNRSTPALLKEWAQLPKPTKEPDTSAKTSRHWQGTILSVARPSITFQVTGNPSNSSPETGQGVSLFTNGKRFASATVVRFEKGTLSVNLLPNNSPAKTAAAIEIENSPNDTPQGKLALPDLEVGSQWVIHEDLDNATGHEATLTPQQKVTQFAKWVTTGDWANVKAFLSELPPAEANRVYAHLLKSLATPNQSVLPEGLSPAFERQVASMIRRSGQKVPTSYLSPNDILEISEAMPMVATEPSLINAAVNTKADDPVTGEWQGIHFDAPFSMSLNLMDGSVTGSMTLGEGVDALLKVEEGSWTPANNTLYLKLSVVGAAREMTVDLNATITDQTMTGNTSPPPATTPFSARKVAREALAADDSTLAENEDSNTPQTDDLPKANTSGAIATSPKNTKQHIPALALLIRSALNAGHDFTEFVSVLDKGTTHFGSPDPLKRLDAANLLLQANMIDDVERFLPAAEDDANSIAAQKLWSQLALRRYKTSKTAKWLNIAWNANQKIAESAVVEADKNMALATLIELSPQVDKETGIEWLQNSFTSSPELGMKILSSLGSKSATMAGQAAQLKANKRLELLKLQNQTVEQLIIVAPENAQSWQQALTLLIQNWLKEAEISLELSKQNMGGNVMQIDVYGNFYWLNPQQMAQRRSGQLRANPIQPNELLEIAPGDFWQQQVNKSLQTQVTKTLARLHLRLNEEDKAFPYIESIAKTRPDIARELVDEFLTTWTKNHDPNAARRQTNPYIYQYGFDRKAEAIPLTRSKQERNLAALTKWVDRIRAMELGDIDESKLARAFTTCHSNAEVFKLDRVRSVFGDLSKMDPDTIAEICQKMRTNLSSKWKDIRQQEAMQTNRREPEVQEEVLRGYTVAKQLLTEALKSAPENWKLQLALATLIYDENSYAQSVQKSSDFSEVRNSAFEAFAEAATKYQAALPNLNQSQQSTEVYDRWFYASLGASDLGRITDKTTPDKRQFKKIRDAINNLPGEMAEVHMAKFANNLFTRMSPLKPEIKFRYLEAGFEIAEAHPRAWEAKKLFDYYRDLVSEIRLDVALDGDDNVGHEQPFGFYVNILHTPEIERESGGFGKYAQNQNSMMRAYNYGRPTEDYRDKFSESVSQALEEHFEILNITFQSPSTMQSRSTSEPEWRVTPYAYVLVKPRGPEVDRVPPLQLNLDFLDTSGYVVIPVESPAVVIDASDPQGTARPIEDLQITQTLDERQAEDGKLIVEVSATGKGLIPQLEDLIDLEREDFELVSVDDQGVLPTAFEKDSDEIQILSDRSWTVEYQAKQSQGEMASFKFGEPKPPEAIVKFQRYEDADLVGVEQTVTLAKKYGSFSWGFLSWLIPLIAIGIVGGIFATLFLSKPPEEQRSRFHVPNDVNAFSVLTLLNDIKQRNGISAELSQELQSSINRVEESYFGSEDATDTENLAELAQTWVKRAK